MNGFTPVVLSAGKVKRKLLGFMTLKEITITGSVTLLLYLIGKSISDLMSLVFAAGGVGIGIFFFMPIANQSMATLLMNGLYYFAKVPKHYYYYNEIKEEVDEVEIEEKTKEQRFKPTINKKR